VNTVVGWPCRSGGWRPSEVQDPRVGADRAGQATRPEAAAKWKAAAALTSAEESSTQAGACFLAWIEAENLLEPADELATEALREAISSGDGTPYGLADGGQVPLMAILAQRIRHTALVGLRRRLPAQVNLRLGLHEAVPVTTAACR